MEIIRQKISELRDKLQIIDAQLPLSESTHVLFDRVRVGDMTITNKIALQPMEGCDSNPDGSPGELTYARYRRFAEGGAGLIWLEAVAVLPQGRANPRQLHITQNNADNFKRLICEIKENSMRKNGHEAKVIMQATHSGRYSKPNGTPEPIIAYNNPLFEKDNPIDKRRIITDDELKKLEEAYGKAAGKNHV